MDKVKCKVDVGFLVPVKQYNRDVAGVSISKENTYLMKAM